MSKMQARTGGKLVEGSACGWSLEGREGRTVGVHVLRL